MATMEERQPLLGTTPDDIQASAPPGNKTTPLPWKQLLNLLLMQICEPLAATVIYPFIAELVNNTGITGGDPGKVGYYAGLIESIFFLTEGVFVLQYGRISDRIGRRPVLLFGICGLSLSIFSFGLSKTFAGLVLTRALSGALNGNIGVSKSMMAELTDETNQAQCFSLVPIQWSLGATIGPLLGGTFSHPDTLIPRVFNTPFWRQYPYFLPCLITATFIVCVFVYSVLNLEETLHKNDKSELNPQNRAEFGTADGFPCTPPPSALSIRSILTARARIAIANYACLAFIDIAYMGIVPVMFASPISFGGLDLSPRVIGCILGAQGVVTGIAPILSFSPLHRRFGSKQIYITGLVCYLGMIITFPVMNSLAGHGRRDWMWVVMAVHLVLSYPAFMAFVCTTMFITAAAPSKSSLGTLNGISQTTISIIRAIGPATATGLFALSAEKRLLGGRFVYVVLAGANLAGLVAAQWLEDEPPAH